MVVGIRIKPRYTPEVNDLFDRKSVSYLKIVIRETNKINIGYSPTSF